MKKYDFDSSQAFIKQLKIKPYQAGKLNELTFAVKDLIDINGEITGSGNPSWLKTHPKACCNAVCVDQLLSEGAVCLGKTITDELAFSLIGENHFYGTPLNPAAPDRVPGGSSSGSASAVACGLVDFALGTDTGGSVRVPASNCGIWGFRPSHGVISVAGVTPFAPAFDTVGVLARAGDILATAASVLLSSPLISNYLSPKIYFLKDLFLICDKEIQQSLTPVIAALTDLYSLEETDLKQITNEAIDYKWLFDTYAVLQSAEIWSTLGAWIEAAQPEFGPVTHNNFHQLAKALDRTKIQHFSEQREWFAKKLNQFVANKALLCFPTTPQLAPKLGTIGKDVAPRSASTYYPRALGFNALSGLSRAPQITIPVATVSGVPIGLSFLTTYNEDSFLLPVCAEIGVKLTENL